MRSKSNIKFKLYDLVHQTWVSTCIVATLVTTGYLGYGLYNYFKYVKPIKKDIEEKFKEELLKEGRMLTNQDHSSHN